MHTHSYEHTLHKDTRKGDWEKGNLPFTPLCMYHTRAVYLIIGVLEASEEKGDATLDSEL